jgi:predicted secreted protein
MKKTLALTVCAVALAACQAPQAKKYSDTKRELPAIAMPPAVDHAVIYEVERGSLVAVKPGGTITVYLSANSKSDSKWRLSYIPDPTVLKLVSQEFVPMEGSYRGEEKWVFEAVGEGEIDLRLWYPSPRREAFGSTPVFSCVVAVGDELSPVAKGPDDKDMPAPINHVPKKAPRKQAPKAKKQAAPVDESAPFSEPVFRSSGVPLRDQHDRRQQQG